MKQTEKSFCPSCFYFFDWCSVFDAPDLEISPIDGDPSICLNCGRLLIYRGDQAQAATSADVSELMKDRAVWEKIEQIRNAIMARGRYFSNSRFEDL